MRSAVCLQQSICEKIHSRECVFCTHMQIYWLSTGLCTRRHPHRHCASVCVCVWQTATSLYLPSDVPCVPPRLPLHPFFFFSSVNTSLPHSSLLLYHCLLPQITESLKGQRETLKKRETENGKRGEALVGVSLSFPPTKGQWASISGLSVDTGQQNEQPTGWISMDEK